MLRLHQYRSVRRWRQREVKKTVRSKTHDSKTEQSLSAPRNARIAQACIQWYCKEPYVQLPAVSEYIQATRYMGRQVCTFPPGSPISSIACMIIFSVFPEANVRVILLTGIFLLALTMRQSLSQLRQNQFGLTLAVTTSRPVFYTRNVLIFHWMSRLVFAS